MNKYPPYRIWDLKNKSFDVYDGIKCFYIDPFSGNIVIFHGTAESHVIDGRLMASYGYSPNPEWVGRNRFVEQRFSGLRDKNGRPIYEGDIVYSVDDSRYYEVRFHQGMFTIYVGYEDGHTPLYEYTQDGLVAGNIFENPRLLADQFMKP